MTIRAWSRGKSSGSTNSTSTSRRGMKKRPFSRRYFRPRHARSAAFGIVPSNAKLKLLPQSPVWRTRTTRAAGTAFARTSAPLAARISSRVLPAQTPGRVEDQVLAGPHALDSLGERLPRGVHDRQPRSLHVRQRPHPVESRDPADDRPRDLVFVTERARLECAVQHDHQDGGVDQGEMARQEENPARPPCADLVESANLHPVPEREKRAAEPRDQPSKAVSKHGHHRSVLKRLSVEITRP